MASCYFLYGWEWGWFQALLNVWGSSSVDLVSLATIATVARSVKQFKCSFAFFLELLALQFYWPLQNMKLASFSLLIPFFDLVWSWRSLQFYLQLVPQQDFFDFNTFRITNYIINTVIINMIVISQNHFIHLIVISVFTTVGTNIGSSTFLHPPSEFYRKVMSFVQLFCFGLKIWCIPTGWPSAWSTQFSVVLWLANLAQFELSHVWYAHFIKFLHQSKNIFPSPPKNCWNVLKSYNRVTRLFLRIVAILVASAHKLYLKKEEKLYPIEECKNFLFNTAILLRNTWGSLLELNTHHFLLANPFKI